MLSGFIGKHRLVVTLFNALYCSVLLDADNQSGGVAELTLYWVVGIGIFGFCG